MGVLNEPDGSDEDANPPSQIQQNNDLALAVLPSIQENVKMK
jgi:hypothetical protein